jgi:hypothetical protein
VVDELGEQLGAHPMAGAGDRVDGQLLLSGHGWDLTCSSGESRGGAEAPTDAGEWLERRVPESGLVRTHTELGDTTLPWVIGLALVAVVILARHLVAGRTVSRHGGPGAAVAEAAPRTRRQAGGVAATVVIAVLAVVIGLGSIVTVYRIGESGAAAAWTDQFSVQPQSDPGGPPHGDD